ncbi:WS/DGAT/MGAT family acyltransferase [Saccharothrix tamanrassetensis]|uniref:diacylglycerol O-acyltransferase n=1 Tax=Saccharothrix tamanrassetensis TaxID=1051531 RepID=A0A841CME6_9PSEU|nr:wax ester/triacylglycerol synthase domain-containing protein [Saccharothrix tamanrassetensis]MBB5957175.1 WS/DGAT/MGAT family acyltransferase [Saccharothrix tamanrassetensis]
MRSTDARRSAHAVWRSPTEMNALETLFWRSENHPGMRSSMLGVLVLDRCPDWDRLVARHEWATRIVPRLRHRVLEPPMRLGRPFWVVDRTFDVRNHLRRVRLPTPGTTRQLLDFAQTAATAALAPERPLWEVTLVEGLDDGFDGKAAYLLKVHHSISDGIGVAQLITVLTDSPAEHDADPLLPPAPRPGPRSATALLAGRLGRQFTRPVLAAARAGRRARVPPPVRPRRWSPPSAHRITQWVAAFARATLVPPAPASPLLRERSRAVHFDAVDIPVRSLREAGKAGGGTMNDAFVAGLMGGFERYHHRFGLSLESVPLLVPISVRTRHDLPAGNRLASTRLAIPVAGLDAAERVAEVHRRIAAVRSRTTLQALDALSRPITPFPGPLIRFVFTQMFRGNDLIATNFPGVQAELRLAGARVLRASPFAPLLRGATSIALTTYRDTCRIGITLDTGAFTEPDVFVACLRESFAEIVALAPGRTASPMTA